MATRVAQVRDMLSVGVWMNDGWIGMDGFSLALCSKTCPGASCAHLTTDSSGHQQSSRHWRTHGGSDGPNSDELGFTYPFGSRLEICGTVKLCLCIQCVSASETPRNSEHVGASGWCNKLSQA